MIDDVDNVLLYPEAFAVLVMAKWYSVAKSALVPKVVNYDAGLVEANAKLSLLSGISGFVAAVPGIALLKLGGAPWVLGLATATFALGAVVSLRMPRAAVATEPPDEAERTELRSAGILLAASGMGLLRAIVGFLTFLLAFALRTDDAPTWWFGIVVAASLVGTLGGAVLAPVARRSIAEERILAGSLGLVTVVGLFVALAGGRAAWAVLAATVGLAASAGKLAFDAIVQRDAPDANRGRSFARFETRFQIAWVVGALLPVVLPLGPTLGFVLVAGTAGFAAFSYVAGLRTVAHRPPA
jgi:hypothetical protein